MPRSSIDRGSFVGMVIGPEALGLITIKADIRPLSPPHAGSFKVNLLGVVLHQIRARALEARRR
jgi:hypothetical protein